MDPDSVPGDPKTYGSYGSGSATLVRTQGKADILEDEVMQRTVRGTVPYVKLLLLL